MSVLRLHGSLLDAPQACRWALVNADRDTVTGEGALADLPRHAGRMQLVLPAGEVRFARTRLPPNARHDAGLALAFALEESTATEPEANEVRWLANVDGDDVLAVFDQPGFDLWRAALDAAGVHDYEVHCETLFLPWQSGAWHLCWNGRDGFVRTGPFEGAATDGGGRDMPPLALGLLLDEARVRATRPDLIVVHPTAPEAVPDGAAWARELGVAVQAGAPWPWHAPPADAGTPLVVQRKRWHSLSGLATRLRPAAALVAIALAVHALALTLEWTALSREQAALHAQLEARFRGAFPDAVAVADPSLQMRRKLAEARHAAGEPDPGDFVPMLGQVAAATGDAPAGTLRGITYEQDRLAVELAGVDAGAVQRVIGRLREAGLRVEATPDPVPAGSTSVVLTVHAP